MDAVAVPQGVALAPGAVSLSALSPGPRASVVSVGARPGLATAVARRLVELGFVAGEHVEVVTEARPGRDPFVVRVGYTTLALRRREVENVWVEIGPTQPAP